MKKTIIIVSLCLLATEAAIVLPTLKAAGLERLCDHEVVLDKDGRLLPWTSYDNVIRWSMNYIKRCPTTRTRFGNDPWYLVTSKLTEKGEFFRNQNCQGSLSYWAVETLTRYYAYSGDEDAIASVKLLLDRVLSYHTPADWAWPNVPRTQDNKPDGEYTDETSEPDKMCMVGVAYIKFYKLTGDEKYLEAARRIAETLAGHVVQGDAKRSPLPFGVNLRNGKVLLPYTANMVAPALFFDEMIRLGETGNGVYQAKRDLIWAWILKYPVKNNEWGCYYEDVDWGPGNMNQHSPLETARFMLNRPALDPDHREHVTELLAWVENRFGKTKRYGATSVREQDHCNVEMSSHTARYASIAAGLFGLTQDPKWREEARASFALATYSAYSKYSKGNMAVNYVGIGYVNPWFTDSYFDYLCHILDGMAEMPEMAPADADHLIGTDSIVSEVSYRPGRIEYTTFESRGNEILRITFKPQTVTADGKPLADTEWRYGEYRGVPGVLQIHRKSANNIVISAK